MPGSGNVVSESRAVSGFDSVAFRGSGLLSIDDTGTESLTIEAEDNLLPYLSSEVSGRRLILSVKPNVTIQPSRPIVFRLTVKDLNDIEASGSGEIDAKNLEAETLSLDQSGSFDTSLGGSVTRFRITLSGSGDVLADNLVASEVAVDISGSGDVVVQAGSKLSVRISGSGSVEYAGDPQVTQTISGSGSVRKR